jgi:hypothetical protein
MPGPARSSVRDASFAPNRPSPTILGPRSPSRSPAIASRTLRAPIHRATIRRASSHNSEVTRSSPRRVKEANGLRDVQLAGEPRECELEGLYYRFPRDWLLIPQQPSGERDRGRLEIVGRHLQHWTSALRTDLIPLTHAESGRSGWQCADLTRSRRPGSACQQQNRKKR